MTLSNVTSGLADSCANITARRLKRFAWQGRAGSALHPLVSAELARGVCAVIPLFCQLARPTIGIHGNKNAVVFMETMADGIFDHTGVWKSSDKINQHNA